MTTRYAYDAAGRMVREGNKTYRYGYLDKVLSVTDGDTTRTYTYHADGQLATASYSDNGRARTPAAPQTEAFQWDGLALIQRGDEQFVNEPHVGGGNPVASSKGTSYFNDALGTTVGSKSNGKYSAAALTAFGENLSVDSPTPTQNSNFFTGKPYVEGLGHAFWMRNYRAGLAKWQTVDPMGYPDGWNQLAYCGNEVTSAVDLWGCSYNPEELTSAELIELNIALSMYLDVGTLPGVGYIFENTSLTRDFLHRYIYKRGDHELSYSAIADQPILQKNIGLVVARVRAGDYSSGNFSIEGRNRSSLDLSHSLGGVIVYYMVEEIAGPNNSLLQCIDFWIDDLYDFHARSDGKTLVAPMPGLNKLWGGPDYVYDTWMRQLANNGYAEVFNTHVEWFVILE